MAAAVGAVVYYGRPAPPAVPIQPNASEPADSLIAVHVSGEVVEPGLVEVAYSGRVADAQKLYTKFASIARGLQRDVHYEVDEEKRTVAPLEEGVHAVERALGIDNLYEQVSANLVHQLQAALRAKELYRKDKDYIVADGEVKIVDEFTGRVLDGRRYSEGLHQAIEAKEGVKIRKRTRRWRPSPCRTTSVCTRSSPG